MGLRASAQGGAQPYRDDSAGPGQRQPGTPQGENRHTHREKRTAGESEGRGEPARSDDERRPSGPFLSASHSIRSASQQSQTRVGQRVKSRKSCVGPGAHGSRHTILLRCLCLGLHRVPVRRAHGSPHTRPRTSASCFRR
ncbi:hypothetical protein A176_007477 [Myxococcus hansupus]|uniref:Uncharacterized protein n=1 Tax=Pseudomyxococcus hansupus TaxID=1297742 RepID=A0A0H4XAA4_9BACT|nr:hypothetical protein A176_007477 [Myxococcus hansupus]